MPDNYERAFTVASVVDGDTIKVADVDLGYHCHIHGVQYRVLGVNCPELHKPTLEVGKAAKAYTEWWLTEHATHGGLYATTTKTDDFGRYLAAIGCGDGHDLSTSLLLNGHAVPYKAK